jgi:ribosome maturation factor RimP
MAHSSGGPPARRFFVGISKVRGKTPEDRSLLELLDPVAEAAGYAIVRLRMMGGSKAGRTLQVMAERPADGDMDIDDCTRLSRAISEVLDAADPVEGEYRLEVSSPGVDRPLTRLKDFEAYEGLEAKIELDRVVENRKRFKGVIAGVEGDDVLIDLEGETETAQIPFAWVSEAKLTLSDELLKRGAAARAARLEAESPDQDQPDAEEDA